MRENCATGKCVKLTLLVLNLIFLLMAILLISLGGYALHKLELLSHVVNSVLPSFLIVLGVMMFLLSFFGCCGAWRESKTMLLIYLLALFFLLLAQMIVGGVAYQYKNDAERTLGNQWRSNFADSDRNFFQNEFTCCGYDNVSDCIGSNCVTQAQFNTTTGLKPGCGTKLRSYIDNNLIIVEVIGLTFGSIQMLGLCLAFFLYCCIKCCPQEDSSQELYMLERGSRKRKDKFTPKRPSKKGTKKKKAGGS